MSALQYALIGLFALSSSTAMTAPPHTDCSASEYRQFDFWLGDWDVYETGETATPIARAQVSRIAAGCGLYERYEQFDGLLGESILSFDAGRRIWQQTWITNRGSLMVLSGSLEDGAIQLEGTVHLRDGSSRRQRIRWITAGEVVRETALISHDDGKSWAPAFDVEFRKRS